MGCIARGRFQGERQHALDLLIADFARRARTGLIQQTIQTPFQKARPPFTHGLFGDLSSAPPQYSSLPVRIPEQSLTAEPVPAPTWADDSTLQRRLLVSSYDQLRNRSSRPHPCTPLYKRREPQRILFNELQRQHTNSIARSRGVRTRACRVETHLDPGLGFRPSAFDFRQYFFHVLPGSCQTPRNAVVFLNQMSSLPATLVTRIAPGTRQMLETAIEISIRGKARSRADGPCLSARPRPPVDRRRARRRQNHFGPAARPRRRRAFQRVQFTSDMLPADVLGVIVSTAQTEEFEFNQDRSSPIPPRR